jgi:DnaJ-class molecular chaperone
MACTYCNGRGEVPTYHRGTEFTIYDISGWLSCPRCQGTGVNPTEQRTAAPAAREGSGDESV